MSKSELFVNNLHSLTTGLATGYRIALSKDGRFESIKSTFYNRNSHQNTLDKVKTYLATNKESLFQNNNLRNSLHSSIEKRIECLNNRLNGFFSFFLFASTRRKIEASIKTLTDLKIIIEDQQEDSFIKRAQVSISPLLSPSTPYRTPRKSPQVRNPSTPSKLFH